MKKLPTASDYVNRLESLSGEALTSYLSQISEIKAHLSKGNMKIDVKVFNNQVSKIQELKHRLFWDNKKNRILFKVIDLIKDERLKKALKQIMNSHHAQMLNCIIDWRKEYEKELEKRLIIENQTSAILN